MIICIFVRKIHRKATTNIPRVDELLAGPSNFGVSQHGILVYRPPGFGASQLGIRAQVNDYLGAQVGVSTSIFGYWLVIAEY